jgi:hypothetical protein
MFKQLPWSKVMCFVHDDYIPNLLQLYQTFSQSCYLSSQDATWQLHTETSVHVWYHVNGKEKTPAYISGCYSFK